MIPGLETNCDMAQLRGATIYFTTNGATPTTSSSVYDGSFPVSASETLKTMAVAPGYSESVIASATYTIAPQATPVFSPAGGTYASNQSVRISDATAGATIYFTTNRATPTTSSTKYTGAMTVSASKTIKAIAVTTGYTQSAVAPATNTLRTATPTFSPAPVHTRGRELLLYPIQRQAPRSTAQPTARLRRPARPAIPARSPQKRRRQSRRLPWHRASRRAQ